MKSAYELAMERLNREDPDGGISLTEEQKNQLAEVDRTYDARIAERNIFLKSKLKEAIRNQDAEAAGQLETQMRSERLRLEDEREAKKNSIRKTEA